MDVFVRPFEPRDIPQMIALWNDVVTQGMEFPQMELLTDTSAEPFFLSQTLTAVAEKHGSVLGLYILHPNNVGRCGHICNASYVVRPSARGMHIGEALVRDCLAQAKSIGFRILQFNAVVESNLPAIRLYEKLGFVKIGVVPGGFLLKDGSFADIGLYYHKL